MLEMLPIDQCPQALREIIAPFVVQLWSQYKIVLPDRSIITNCKMVMIDPVQIALELFESGGSPIIMSDNPAKSGIGITIDLSADNVLLGDHIVTEGKLIGWDGSTDVKIPILADFSHAHDSRWLYIQQAPLDGDRLWLRLVGHDIADVAQPPFSIHMPPWFQFGDTDYYPPTPISAALRLCVAVLNIPIIDQTAIDASIAMIAEESIATFAILRGHFTRTP